MMYIQLILEDNVFIATQAIHSDDSWDVTSTNLQTGDRAHGVMKTEEIQAISALAICGEDCPFLISERAYVIAEKAISLWKKECCPIP